MPDSVLWLKDVSKDDISLVGSKGVSLGEMLHAGFPVPDGFVITASVYFAFLHQNKLIAKINQLLSTVNFDQSDSVLQVAQHIKKLIMHTAIAETSIHDIDNAYRKFGGGITTMPVVLHASSTSANLLFAGQQETIRNLQGEANLIMKIREIWASIFEPRALLYRNEHHVDHFRDGIAIVVQKMITPDVSGMMLTLDPVMYDKSKIIIETHNASEHYTLAKKDLAILKKTTPTQPTLSVNRVLDLALLAKKLEKQYYFPQEITWMIADNTIFILKTKPMATNPKFQFTNQHSLSNRLQLLLQGIPASKGIVRGSVKIVKSIKDLSKIAPGDILVALDVLPSYFFAIKKAAALVTEHGGRASYAAVLPRELGIPAIVGAEKATVVLQEGMVVTVDGEKGEVYSNGTHSAGYHQTATRLYVTVEKQTLATTIAQENVDGIGLLTGQQSYQEIAPNTLAEHLATFCKALTPRPVVYLPSESSSILYHAEVFKQELAAIQIVREKMHLNNLWLMLPFVRTVKELTEIKHLMTAAGLTRSPHFKVWLTIASPANVLLLDELIKVGIDGISIDADRLTGLILGADKDHSETSNTFDPLNPAVLSTLEQTIKTAHRHGITSSIFGEAPSLHSSLVEKLVQWGVTSISVIPDALEITRKTVREAERRLIENRSV